jgi:hypothetical protein
MREKRTAYMIFVRNPKGRRPLGKIICWWVDNINMDLEEI